jgi:hypothetical protein
MWEANMIPCALELDEISGIPGATASNFVGIVENSSDVLELVPHRLLIRPEEHS